MEETKLLAYFLYCLKVSNNIPKPTPKKEAILIRHAAAKHCAYQDR
jgi:hypothetical protein